MKTMIMALLCLGATFAHAENETKPAPAPAAEKAAEPFAFADFTWLNGNSRQKEFPLDSKYFTGQFTFDGNYVYDFAHPRDHSLGGSTNSGRTAEFQVQQLGIGGDFHYENVRGRLMTQFGMYSTMTPRNDSTPSRGQWQLDGAYRYVSEAYGGYHWDIWNGINLDAGIFMSYVGLESYYNFENWNYQMSYVSANTPWFFNGLRLQTFPTDKLKVELWLTNGWQSYGMYNESPGGGWQVLWRPNADWSFVSNEWIGRDTLGNAPRLRLHSDNSVQYKYFENASKDLNRAAFSFTADLGCERGGGVSCLNSRPGAPSQNFFGLMAYNRFWFNKDKFGLTFGGGMINNPGRYLVLVPPINGATAAANTSTNAAGSNYFSQQPGDGFTAWDSSLTFDYMPSQFITFRTEYIHRQASVPYFSGAQGVTPPGGNTGTPATAVATGWRPDLSKTENRINLALLVRF